MTSWANVCVSACVDTLPDHLHCNKEIKQKFGINNPLCVVCVCMCVCVCVCVCVCGVCVCVCVWCVCVLHSGSSVMKKICTWQKKSLIFF